MTSESKELQAGQRQVPAAKRVRTLIPHTDIYERTDSLVVLVDLPGADEQSVEIHVERNLLSIGADVEAEAVPGHQPTYLEYESGRFERQFTLSDEVDCGRIEATVRDGVLRIVLPKAESAKPRKIEVRAG